MTVPAEVREHCREARGSARTDGLVPALALLTRALSPKAPPRGPRGHAVLPKELLDEFAAMEAEDARRDERRDDEPLPGLAVLRPADPVQAAAPDGTDARVWGTGLAWLRLGMSERLREACVAYLAARQVEGTSLLMQQMVKGTLADVLIEHLEIEGVLEELADGPGGDGTLDRLQRQITRADRTLLRLLGAHGFTQDGPGPAAHASELLADVYRGEPA
ncbi:MULTISPECIES: hypothetical protein [unclassified Streptomyces]|jgi:hypothetical protein|uniref:hypothetical protein n=1 Tax=unclassified Streptomyces TaxID=2593676 RepID=UPI0007498787|nr:MULTISPECIES: hypothetical protein [unclassified Streptomyces]KUL72573.1 hypothetical protein ADL34_23000 [Streptomyces sp. NRRL WC-3605]KUL74605.1 hypothetical protein ADL33_16695 [Streptomyces sp. NRRL WC-3604]